MFSAANVLALFAPWKTARGILLGVSGGPDSLALMLLAAEWSRECATPPISVATVDHGLRKDSASEAQTVGQWAKEIGLPHAILYWSGTKPRSRLQERARDARYRLLFEHAGQIGADHVMTAHHADDQAETILFRLLRGSGISGLSGMAKCRQHSQHKGFFLARPLLNFTKADLAAFCEMKAHAFIKDPSNADPVFARTRIRRLGCLLAEEGLDRASLLRLGRRAARVETALGAQARTAIEKLRVQREPGSISADISVLAGEPEEILLRFLADELKLIGGKSLRLERLESLTEALAQALRSGFAYKATLAGAVLRLQSCGFLVIEREGSRRRGANASYKGVPGPV